MALRPADIRWGDNNTPISNQFDDVYFSPQNGLEETRYTFLEANGLPHRWQEQSKHCVIELGFGSGLNFLATWKLWKDDTKRSHSLHFVSIEKYPLHVDDLKKILSFWPELKELADELIVHYPPLMEGSHHLVFDDGRVTLTLLWGEALDVLKSLKAKANTWFLDGFAPQKNPDMWSDDLIHQIAIHSALDCHLATFTSVGKIRRGLMNAGFDMERIKGYGHKRHMIKGVKRVMDTESISCRLDDDPWFHFNSKSHLKNQVTVVGAGLAGCATARVLSERGFEVTVVDKSTVASGASGNSQGIFQPLPTLDNSLLCQFYSRAFLLLLRRLPYLLEDHLYDSCGCWHPDLDTEKAVKNIKMCETLNWPQNILRYVSAHEATELTGVTCSHGGVYFEKAGWLSPQHLCLNLLDHDNVEVVEYHHVLSSDDILLSDSDFVVWSNAGEVLTFEAMRSLPLKKIRGQTSHFPQNKQNEKLKSVICDQSYMMPVRYGRSHVGATYHIEDDTAQARTEDDQANWNGLYEPLRAGSATPSSIESRVSSRWALPDYFPLVGPCHDTNFYLKHYADVHHGHRFKEYPLAQSVEGHFMNVGHGSRGIVSCLLTAEIITSYITGSPQPIEWRLLKALHPARFLIRELKKGACGDDKAP